MTLVEPDIDITTLLIVPPDPVGEDGRLDGISYTDEDDCIAELKHYEEETEGDIDWDDEPLRGWEYALYY